MSYSTPFLRDDGSFRRKQKADELVAEARLAAEQMPAPGKGNETVAAQPERRVEKSATVPPVLELLLYHEEGRAAARAAGDFRLADRALVDVVHDLDVLLNGAEVYLAQPADARARQRVRDAVPHLVTISAVAAMPLGEVAGFLGLPPDRVETVLDSLARHGDVDPAERREALQQLQWLRGQLRQAELTHDHTLLDRILAFVSKFVLLGVITLAAAAAGAFAVSESVVKEVVKTAVIALVAASLQMSSDHLKAKPDKGKEFVAARQAHAALLADLKSAGVLWEEPAFDGEHAIIRIRLAVHMCVARVASIPLVWKDKWHYWDALDDVTAALKASTSDELSVKVRRLAALRPPARAQNKRSGRRR
ncbi:hypothetical protein [Lentzea cavernae]|uniref:Uncharacterized protein n=1 Tax=Lentzea cavernae TaxID=2020703 RepID=A0ABQ3MEG6_9PSEU|nr:hypothetical protein [Lentzea cavernae]GHH42324.1 hypothetical protein GCM10017774_38510 [Lentzea cavernae]